MKIISKNKRAQLDYEIESEFEAGIVLRGFEVKSIRLGQVNIGPAIVKILGNEAFITNMDIPLYYKTSPILAPNYDPKGTRKLLLKKKEITKIITKTHKNGLTIIPLMVFLNKNGFVKISIGIGKLRKKIEKKQILKEKEIDRETARTISNIRFR